MKREGINNFDSDDMDYDIDNNDDNPFDILSEPPKDLVQGPQLSSEDLKTLISSLEAKLDNRDVYQDVLPEGYFDDIEDTLRSLKGRYQDMEGRNTLEEDTQSHLEDDGEER